MPRFLEKKLQEKYGKDSDVPYKIINKLGFMKGSKETSKGKEAEKKHEKHEKDEKLTGQKLPESFKHKMVDKMVKKGK